VNGTGPRYERFTPSERAQHALLIFSFSVLALTGLPQMNPDQRLSATLIGALGGIEGVRIIHRVAATLLMVLCVWHLVEVLYKLYVRRVPLGMVPGLQDLRDAQGALRYNLGIDRERPRMGRYTFEEKAEYWALLWGTLVMIATGFMLWNPIATATALPGQFIPAARAAHGGEALLAVLSIIAWHMYGVHLKHFNRSMFTGYLSEQEMLHEHPLELERVQAGLPYGEPSAEEVARRRRNFLPVAIVLGALLGAAIYWFVTFEQTAIATLPPPR
jgi:cytochrome b subunit of formate dehydrogenase